MALEKELINGKGVKTSYHQNRQYLYGRRYQSHGKSYTDESYRQQEKERESLIERQKEVKEQLEEEMAKTGEEYSKEKVIALTEENNEIGFPVPLDLSIFVYTFQYPLDKETAVSYESMYEKLKQEPMFEGAIDVAEGGE